MSTKIADYLSPNSFLHEKVLTDPKARLWFETTLSVASYLKAIYKNIVASPKIWLLTGVYLMDDAKVFTLESKSDDNSVAVNIPIPEPTGLAALLGVSPGASVSLGKRYTATAMTQILGGKVWAAQWTRVKAKYIPINKKCTGSQLLINQLQLLDVWSTGTSRGDGGQRSIVELEIDITHDGRAINDDGDEYDDEVWMKFEEHVDDLIDDLGEDPER
jgi:hypothetical protein